MLPWPSLFWTSGSDTLQSIACEPWACRNQRAETRASMPAFYRRTLHHVVDGALRQPPPLRLANTGSLAPASLRSDRSDRLTTLGRSSWGANEAKLGFSPIAFAQ